MSDKSRLIVAFCLCIVLGIGIGFAFVKFEAPISRWFVTQPLLYQAQNADILNRFDGEKNINLEWSQLLPENEKTVLQKYQQVQASTPSELTDNILRSIEAANDQGYSDALMSINTVNTFVDKSVSIAGFIVPIDFNEKQQPNNIFIVPYFGACIHFPPPPPNQMIFAQLGQGFDELDITQAYRFKGIMRQGLFEDPLGTSAYILDVVSIEAYFDDPDDFRQH